MDQSLKKKLEAVDTEVAVEKARNQQKKIGPEKFNALCRDDRLIELAALVVNSGGDPMNILGCLVLAFDLGGKPIPEEFLPDVKLPDSLFGECPEDIPESEK